MPHIYRPRFDGGAGGILLTGATGHRYTAGSLVEPPGDAVSGPCRDPGQGSGAGRRVVVGDLDDERSVAEAMIGVDRVFLNAGGAVPAPGEQPMVRQQRR